MHGPFAAWLTPVSTKPRSEAMQVYSFDVILKNVSEMTDDLADCLFAAGCDDGTPASSGGISWVHFDREASSLEEAIRSAVGQVQAAGLTVTKVELGVEQAALMP
jgi:hypothetical protein